MSQFAKDHINSITNPGFHSDFLLFHKHVTIAYYYYHCTGKNLICIIGIHTCITRNLKWITQEVLLLDTFRGQWYIWGFPVRQMFIGQEKPHLYHGPLHMYNSQLQMSYIQRFCFTHVHGPTIYKRSFLPNDDLYMSDVSIADVFVPDNFLSRGYSMVPVVANSKEWQMFRKCH